MKHIFVAAFFPLVVACAGAPEASPEAFAVPTSAHFDSVARTLDAHCGTLDCHGSTRRNLRLFGYSGRRLDPPYISGIGATTAREAGADYCSVTALEPESLARVTAEGGASPERLTLVRKARGTEKHAGNTVFPTGGPGDLCLVAWLSGRSGDLPALCDASLGDLRDPPPPTAGVVDLSACDSGLGGSP